VSDGAAVRRLGLAQVCPIHQLESADAAKVQSSIKLARVDQVINSDFLMSGWSQNAKNSH
jgi:hypothetical protein